MTTLAHYLSKGFLFTLSLALGLATTADRASAKYVTISKAPKSFLHKTQQVQYHYRWLKEYHSYGKHHSQRVRTWNQNLMSKRNNNTVKQLRSLYALAG